MADLFPQLTKGEEFIVKWQYRMLGDFKTALIEAICLADSQNLERLRLGFPDEVEGYLNYSRVEGWWQEVQRKAGKETP
jgi:hypothetical protein